jgi:hypothetical protein
MEDPKVDAIKAVMNSILEDADRERKLSEPYKKLFKESDDLDSLMRNTYDEMMNTILDTCTVLEEKFGYKRINKNVFDILRSLPLLADSLEKDITEKEGYSCCVDKAYHIITERVKKEKE